MVKDLGQHQVWDLGFYVEFKVIAQNFYGKKEGVGIFLHMFCYRKQTYMDSPFPSTDVLLWPHEKSSVSHWPSSCCAHMTLLPCINTWQEQPCEHRAVINTMYNFPYTPTLHLRRHKHPRALYYLVERSGAKCASAAPSSLISSSCWGRVQMWGGSNK